jgi:hypothetical protein
VARFGEVHPRVLKGLDIETPSQPSRYCSMPYRCRGEIRTARPLLKPSPFQPVTRDFAFLLDAHVPADKLIRAAKGAEKTLIRAVNLFDVYTGKGVPEGKKSLAIAVTLQATDRTLTDTEIEAISEKIVRPGSQGDRRELAESERIYLPLDGGGRCEAPGGGDAPLPSSRTHRRHATLGQLRNFGEDGARTGASTSCAMRMPRVISTAPARD